MASTKFLVIHFSRDNVIYSDYNHQLTYLPIEIRYNINFPRKCHGNYIEVKNIN